MRGPLGTSYDDMDAGASALASIIAPITGCVLIRQRIIYKAVAVPKPATLDSSPVKRRGVFIFRDGSGGAQALVEVPGILESTLSTDEPGAGVLIDLSNADIAAVVSSIEAGIWVTPFGEDIVSIVTAYRQSRVQ